MLVALKIDLLSPADLPRDLPPLLKLLEEYQLKASFFPALGGGKAGTGLLKRLLGAGGLSEEALDLLSEMRARGHEVGATAGDAHEWHAQIQQQDAAWTRGRLEGAVENYRQLFGDLPQAFAAPDFLLNADAPWLEAELGLRYAVDSRGLGPYLPVTPQGPVRCMQVPVTLPRIQDMLAAGEPLEDVHQSLFMEVQKPLLPGHVFSYSAGDPRHLAVLEKLIVMWMGSQRKPVTLGELLKEVDTEALAYHQIGMLRRSESEPYQAVQGQRVSND